MRLLQQFRNRFGGTKDVVPFDATPSQKLDAAADKAPPPVPVFDGEVDWPVDATTGEVYDDEWLFRGLRDAVNEKQFASKMQMRRDAADRRRQRLAEYPVDHPLQENGMLRGRNFLEWGEHVDQMKREGRNEAALSLVYEIIRASTTSATFNEVPPGWYRHAAVIHHKLKDYDGEVKLLGRAIEDYPHDQDFAKRLQKAAQLRRR